jgi:chlorobactene glucosyltransferase
VRSIARADAAQGPRFLRTAIHLCALGALGFAAAALRAGAGWERVAPRDDPGDLPMLSIVVPARDEAANIERCVRSLLAQSLRRFELIVVDDRSTDATPEILRGLAREDARLQVVAGADLPEGWVGKPWALHQGAERARGAWLLFTDADSWHAPHAEASVLQYALEHGVDAVSLGTGQELGSFWERAVLPSALVLIVMAFHDRPIANGQYILVSREAYDALGGHAALRAEIAEDIEFAKRLAADGRFRLKLAGGIDLVRVRMYRSLRQLWNGFRKNVFLGAEGDVARAGSSVAVLGLLSIAPPALALAAFARGRRRAALEALCASVTTIAATSRLLAKLGFPRRLGAFQPLGFAVMGTIVLDATVRVVSGHGVEWRGRRYTGRYKSQKP